MFITRKTLAALGGEAVVLTLAQLLALVIGFIGTVLVTRHLGPQARGVYAWVLTLQGIAAQMATLVTYPAVRKLAAEQPLSQSGPLAGTILLLGAAGSLVSIPFLIYGWFDPHVGTHAHKALAVCFALVPAASVSVSLSALVHIRNNPLHTLSNLIVPRVLMLLTILLFLATQSLALGSAVWVAQLPTVMGLGLTLAAMPVPLKSCIPSLGMAKRLVGFLGASWLGGLTLFALPKLALLRMGQLSTLDDTGHYSIATTLMEVALILPFSAGHVLTSHISKRQKESATAAGFWHHTLMMTAGMAVVCATGALLAGWLLPFLFGENFAAAVTPFRWLMPGVVLATMHQGLNSHVFSHGPKQALWVPPLAGCLTCLATAEILIPGFGATGAAWATCAGYTVMVGTTWGLLKTKRA